MTHQSPSGTLGVRWTGDLDSAGIPAVTAERSTEITLAYLNGVSLWIALSAFSRGEAVPTQVLEVPTQDRTYSEAVSPPTCHALLTMDINPIPPAGS